MVISRPSRPLCLAAIVLAATTVIDLGRVRADVTPAPLFCDHAVLQQGVSLPVWGGAAPGEEVSVSYLDQHQSTTADARGQWMVHLNPLHPKESGILRIKGRNSLTFTDVVTGEVWFCSGQSNMALSLKGALDSEKEIAEANHPLVRQYKVPLKPSDKPESYAWAKSDWKPCSPANASDFSAVAYFFARDLSYALDEPVGIILSAWGDTPIYPWIDIPVLKSNPPVYDSFMERKNKVIAAYGPTKIKREGELQEWQIEADQAKAAGQPFTKPKPLIGDPAALQAMPGGLTNGMLHPILPYAIRGAVWYQGESSSEAGPTGAWEYTQLQPMLIKNWRALWHEGDFPFYFVQLPNYQVPGDKTGDAWPIFREAQAKTLGAVPNVAMTVTIDVGEAGTLHPKNKQAVGHRLALLAEANTYGKPVAAFSPMYRAMKPLDGGKIQVDFDHADGLHVKDGGELNNFIIAGADKQFVPAEAHIEGTSVVVSSAQVPAPVAVRYAWSDDPPNPNLYNKANLPAAPFRTDADESH